MKRLQVILSVLLAFIVTLLLIVIWVLRKNDIMLFDSKKPDYVPLVSKDDKATPQFQKGLDIFLSDCKQCHVTKNRLHNYLDGVVEKYGEEFVAMYITKQDSLIENGDDLTMAIKEEWGNNANNHNFSYSDEDLDNLLEYLK